MNKKYKKATTFAGNLLRIVFLSVALSAPLMGAGAGSQTPGCGAASQFCESSLNVQVCPCGRSLHDALLHIPPKKMSLGTGVSPDSVMVGGSPGAVVALPKTGSITDPTADQIDRLVSRDYTLGTGENALVESLGKREDDLEGAVAVDHATIVADHSMIDENRRLINELLEQQRRLEESTAALKQTVAASRESVVRAEQSIKGLKQETQALRDTVGELKGDSVMVRTMLPSLWETSNRLQGWVAQQESIAGGAKSTSCSSVSPTKVRADSVKKSAVLPDSISIYEQVIGDILLIDQKLEDNGRLSLVPQVREDVKNISDLLMFLISKLNSYRSYFINNRANRVSFTREMKALFAQPLKALDACYSKNRSETFLKELRNRLEHNSYLLETACDS